jgi:tetratricopeptide (TPR) repeat protein
VPDEPRQSVDNSPRISQSMFDGVTAQSIQTGNITQTVVLPQPRPKPTDIPHNIPFRGSGTFVGRQDVLATLHQALHRTDRVAISALTGMGGIGKTELAVQYARAHVQDYPGGVCWLHARAERLVAQLIEYAQNTLMLDVPQERNGQPVTLAQQLAWCWQYWEPAGKVLLVLDDVTELMPCRPILLAPVERFRILLTSRRRALDPSFVELSLEVLSPDAALTLMQRFVGNDRLTAESSTAEALCAWLGYLPLGLELVGRYLAQDRGVSLAAMWDQLQEAHQPLEEASLEGEYPLMTAQWGVRAAFELSWHELDADAQDVARLLSLCAPAAILWELAIRGMQQVKGEDYRIRSARRQLDNLHLVQRVETMADALKLHPLIREFLQGKLVSATAPLMAQDALQRAFTTVMVDMAQHIPPTPPWEMIQAISPVIPHLAEVAQQLTDSLGDDEIVWPFVGLARFYEGQGLYTLAEPWSQACLNTAQKRLGAEHPDVATSLNNLAALYRAQGRYAEAEPLYQRALAIYEQVLGPDHPDVAGSLNNLAMLYRAQGRYAEAEPLHQRALAIYEQVLGPAHPDVATVRENSAVLLADRQRNAEPSKPLLQRIRSWWSAKRDTR